MTQREERSYSAWPPLDISKYRLEINHMAEPDNLAAIGIRVWYAVMTAMTERGLGNPGNFMTEEERRLVSRVASNIRRRSEKERVMFYQRVAREVLQLFSTSRHGDVDPVQWIPLDSDHSSGNASPNK